MRTIAALLLSAACAFPQAFPGIQPGYGGPVILGRGGAAAGRSGTDLINLRPFVQVNGIYDTGLTGFVFEPGGQFPNQASYGVEGNFGVYGYHSWRRTVLGLDYRGSARHYTNAAFYDGVDNYLTLQLTHQPKRHLQIFLGQQLASYSNAFFMPMGGLGYMDPTFSGLTTNDLFNNRTNVLMSTGGLLYQKTARLSFGANGTGFVIKRRNPALIGATGYGSGGNVAYRLSRRQTVGLDYSYYHFGYKHFFGNTDMHGLAMNYAVQLSRHWTFAARVGGYRVEVVSLQQVALDPAVAAILGQGFGITIFHRVYLVPNLGGELARSFRHGSVAFQYTRAVYPGNGIFLTSGSEQASANYNYTGFRKLGLSATGGYSTYNALMQSVGKYRNYTFGLGGSYTLRKNVSLTARLDARRYRIGGIDFNRTFYRAAVGFAFSPGEVPFSIW